MFFQAAWVLALLVLVPLLLGGYVLAQRRRRRFALRYASLSLMDGMRRTRGWRRHIAAALWLASLGVLIAGMARPAVMELIPSDEGVVILTLDNSASMWAGDLQPNRMEAAKTAAAVFVEQLPIKMRVGVVSFSDNAFLLQTPTTDRTLASKAIAALYPRSGTAIGSGLLTALDAINGAFGYQLPKLDKGLFAPAAVVLLTDGENTDGPSPLEIVDQAAERGIRVYTIGVGSNDKTRVLLNGAPIEANLDEATLQQVAERTSARYYNASTEQDLHAVYENLRTELVFRHVPRDVTYVFISTGFVLAFAALLFSFVIANPLP